MKFYVTYKISKMLTMQCSVKESSVYSWQVLNYLLIQKQSMPIISIRREFATVEELGFAVFSDFLYC